MSEAPIVDPADRPAVLAAVENNLFDWFGAFMEYVPGAEFHDTPEMCWSVTNVREPLFNSVLRARLEAGSEDSVIESVVARLRERRVSGLWWTGPQTRPTDICARLGDHGFLCAEVLPGMAMTIDDVCVPSLPPGVHTTVVTERRDLRGWAIPFVVGFSPSTEKIAALARASDYLDMSRIRNTRLLVAYRDAEPVSCSMLFYGSGVAGIYCVATAPAARGLGIGTGVVLESLRLAKGEGYRVAVLHSVLPALSMYERIGFAEVCRLRTCTWPYDGRLRPANAQHQG